MATVKTFLHGSTIRLCVRASQPDGFTPAAVTVTLTSLREITGNQQFTVQNGQFALEPDGYYVLRLDTGARGTGKFVWRALVDGGPNAKAIAEDSFTVRSPQ